MKTEIVRQVAGGMVAAAKRTPLVAERMGQAALAADKLALAGVVEVIPVGMAMVVQAAMPFGQIQMDVAGTVGGLTSACHVRTLITGVWVWATQAGRLLQGVACQ